MAALETAGITAEPEYEMSVDTSLDVQMKYFLIHSILTNFLNGLMFTVGLIGNIFSILVLVRQGLTDTTNIFLTSIATCDLLYLCGDFTLNSQRILARIDEDFSRSFGLIYYKVFGRASNFFLQCGIIHVAVLAMERMTAVLFPFLVSRIFTPFTVKITIAFIYVYIFAFSCPSYFLIGDDLALSMSLEELQNIVHIYLVISNVFIYLVPMLVILVCNIAIGVKIRFSVSNLSLNTRKINASKRLKELKLFKMLLVVCCVAFASFFPRILVIFVSFLNYDIKMTYMRQVFTTCFHIHTSSNFIIYVAMSSKFANTFKQLVCGVN